MVLGRKWRNLAHFFVKNVFLGILGAIASSALHPTPPPTTHVCAVHCCRCYRRSGHYVRTIQSFGRCRIIQRDSSVYGRRQPACWLQLHPLASLRLWTGLAHQHVIAFAAYGKLVYGITYKKSCTSLADLISIILWMQYHVCLTRFLTSFIVSTSTWRWSTRNFQIMCCIHYAEKSQKFHIFEDKIKRRQ